MDEITEKLAQKIKEQGLLSEEKLNECINKILSEHFSADVFIETVRDFGGVEQQKLDSIMQEVLTETASAGSDIGKTLIADEGEKAEEKHDKTASTDTSEHLDFSTIAEAKISDSDLPVKTISQYLTSTVLDISLKDVVNNKLNPQKYTVVKKLSEGGMGEIYLATETDLHRELAFKVMKDKLKNDPAAFLRFIEEAQITGQLEHPNIVPIHEIGIDPDGRLIFTMKLIRGKSLKTIINEEKEYFVTNSASSTDTNASASDSSKQPLSINEKINIFLKVCDAIAFAHSKNVIHRDLKPDNIMVGEFGEVVVMDWGLAKTIGAKNAADDIIAKNIKTVRGTLKVAADMTTDGSFLGTPAFMSPEQAEGAIEKIDKLSDVFALGAVLYNLLTLEYIYDAKTVEQILVQAATGAIKPARQRARFAKIPKELNAIIMKALSFDKAKRYQSVNELKQDLKAFLNSEKISAYKGSAFEKLVKWSKRHPAVSLAATVSLLILFVSLAVIALLYSNMQTAKLEKRTAELTAEKFARISAEREKDALLQKQRAQKEREHAEQLEIENAEMSAQMEDLIQQRASLYSELGKHEEALKNYSKAIEMNDANPQLYIKRGKIYRLTGEYELAIADFNKAIKLDGKNSEAFNQRGTVYLCLKKYDLALEDFKRAINLDKNNASAYNNCATLFLEFKRFDDAIQNIEKALKLNPKLGEAYVNRGLYYLMRDKDYQKALENFEQAVSLSPNNPDAYFNLGKVYYLLYNLIDAEKALSKTIEISPNYLEAYKIRAIVYMRLFDFRKSIEDFSKIIEKNDQDGAALFNRANCYYRLGEFDKALKDYTRAEKLKYGIPSVYFNRGIVYMKLGKRKQAIAEFEKYLKHPNATRWEKMRVRRTIAQLKEPSKSFRFKPRNTQNQQKQFNSEFKINADAYFSIAAAFLRQKNYKQALQNIEKAIQANPQNSEYYRLKGICLRELKQPDKALANFNKAIELAPDNAMAFASRGIAFYNAKKYRRALRDLNKAIQLDKSVLKNENVKKIYDNVKLKLKKSKD